MFQSRPRSRRCRTRTTTAVAEGLPCVVHRCRWCACMRAVIGVPSGPAGAQHDSRSPSKHTVARWVTGRSRRRPWCRGAGRPDCRTPRRATGPAGVERSAIVAGLVVVASGQDGGSGRPFAGIFGPAGCARPCGSAGAPGSPWGADRVGRSAVVVPSRSTVGAPTRVLTTAEVTPGATGLGARHGRADGQRRAPEGGDDRRPAGQAPDSHVGPPFGPGRCNR